MKGYSKLFLGVTIMALFSLLFNQETSAQRNHPRAKRAHVRQHQVRKIDNVRALRVIRRTNLTIRHAQKMVYANKVYTGDFSKAVHHQRYAKVLLRRGKSHRAMLHSRLARQFAFQAIKHNKGVVSDDLNFTAEENEIFGDNIQNEELEKELKTELPDLIFDDSKVSDKELTELEVLDMDPSDYKSE
ncbi:MAG: hypothetical protein J5I47_01670 [Vicingus serpentipes]|nr:hypothetical protein [Vicingus serpentipes]